jgi:hypothetical protein
MTSEIVEAASPFQADDEGSIPFTRSNVFNGLDVINRNRGKFPGGGGVKSAKM